MLRSGYFQRLTRGVRHKKSLVISKGTNRMRQPMQLGLVLVMTLAFTAIRHDREPGATQNLTATTEFSWGPYQVVVEQAAGQDEPERFQNRWRLFEERDFGERVQIQDERGQVLREIRNVRIEATNFVEMTGGGLPELYVRTFGVGVNCCYVEYYFTQDEGLQNLLIFLGGHSVIHEAKDLNGDSRPEFIACNVLAEFGGLSVGGSPCVMMVIAWDGQQYRDRIRHFPAPARNWAQEFQTDLIKGFAKPEGWKEEWYENALKAHRRASTLGYYANLLVIGEGPAARAWLREHADEETREWLFSQEEDLLKELARSTSCRVRVSQEPILSGDECL